MSGLGGHVHESVLLDGVEDAFRTAGVSTRRSVRVRSERVVGHVDLVAMVGPRLIAVEAELSPRRIERDLLKAMALDAHELWIVVPNARVAKRVRRALGGRTTRPDMPGVFVLTLGQSRQRVANCFASFSASNVERKTNP